MNDPLTLERFQDFADAYGGVVARWPEPVRDAAMRMASRPAAIAILLGASALDAALDSWAVPATSGALRERMLADAPATRSFAVRARLWWSGIGIAAGLAGAAAGTAAVAMVPPVDAAPGGSTSFGDVGPQES